MSTLLLIVGGICILILVFGIFLRMVLIALIIAALVALGALTLEYGSTFSEPSPPEPSVIT